MLTREEKMELQNKELYRTTNSKRTIDNKGIWGDTDIVSPLDSLINQILE